MNKSDGSNERNRTSLKNQIIFHRSQSSVLQTLFKYILITHVLAVFLDVSEYFWADSFRPVIHIFPLFH